MSPNPGMADSFRTIAASAEDMKKVGKKLSRHLDILKSSGRIAFLFGGSLAKGCLPSKHRGWSSPYHKRSL